MYRIIYQLICIYRKEGGGVEGGVIQLASSINPGVDITRLYTYGQENSLIQSSYIKDFT